MQRVIFFTLLTISTMVHAHHPAATGTSNVGPILSPTAATLSQSNWIIGASLMHTAIDGFSDAELETFGANDQEVDSITSLQNLFLSAAYGFNEQLQISLSLPYVWQNNMVMAETPSPGIGEAHQHGDFRGMGDITLLLQQNMGNVALQYGIKLDTGDTDVTDQASARLEADHQPGSGSTDYMLGIVYSMPATNTSYDISALYVLAGDGTDAANRGDSLRWNAAVSFAGESIFCYAAELNGEYQMQQKTAGIKNENSGGHVVFLSPGIRLNFENKNSVFASLGVPIAQSLNGTQHETTWRLIMGASFGY